MLSSATVGLSETNAVLTTGGTLTISDVDSPASFVAQAGTAGSYGTFTIDAAGVWTYTASSAHDAFVGGTTYSDTFQVASADRTMTSVTVNIVGTNDAAVLSSATVGLSETNAVLTTGGTLTISDVDSPASFVAQAGTAGSYGTFTIDAAGVWTYTASSAHNEFVGGTTYSDTFQVASADGTTTSVTVNILGTNDAAVLSSATVGLSETNAVLTTGGTLTISDVDSPASFVAQAGTAGSYGTFTIDAAGVWTYTASSAHNEFVGGTTYSDTFQVASADGTTTSVTVNIVGTNDAAVLSSATVGLSETNAVLTTGGTLTISDVDSPATFVAQAGTAGSYGTFTIDAAGAWTYTASSAHNEFVGGTTYSDTFQVASADGTTTSVTVNILGTNDAAVLSSATVGLTETNAVLTTGGTLTISDVDSPASFVAQAGTVGSYGTFTINAAGVWTYTASSAHNAFVGGTTYSDTFQVASADGTTTSVTVNIVGTNDALVVSSLTITETQISFVAADPDSGLALASPFAAPFANPTIASAATTNLTPASQSAAVSGTLQVTDGSATANVIGLYLGTGNADSFTAGSTSTALYGFGGNDILKGGTAADFIFGGSGNDTINLANGDFVAGESIDGGADSDSIVLASGTTVNFSVGTVTNVETLTGSTGNETVTLSALQLAGLGTVNLVSGTDTLNVVANGNISQLADCRTEQHRYRKPHRHRRHRLDHAYRHPAQCNPDRLGHHQSRFRHWRHDQSDVDVDRPQHVDERIDRRGGGDLRGDGRGWRHDHPVGPDRRLLDHRQRLCRYHHRRRGCRHDRGGGRQRHDQPGQWRLRRGRIDRWRCQHRYHRPANGTTVDFSVGTLTNVETLTGSPGSDTVTLSALQLAGLGTVDLGSGSFTTDTLNVVANGDISQLALATMSNIETGNLIGTAGTDSITLTGTQLNTILTGSGIINLGSGTGDTINLTSTSTDLNTLTNASIVGVEAISAATAGAGVTITLSAQTEGFSITGSGFADTITGGDGCRHDRGGGRQRYSRGRHRKRPVRVQHRPQCGDQRRPDHRFQCRRRYHRPGERDLHDDRGHGHADSGAVRRQCSRHRPGCQRPHRLRNRYRQPVLRQQWQCRRRGDAVCPTRPRPCTHQRRLPDLVRSRPSAEGKFERKTHRQARMGQ